MGPAASSPTTASWPRPASGQVALPGSTRRAWVLCVQEPSYSASTLEGPRNPALSAFRPSHGLGWIQTCGQPG